MALCLTNELKTVASVEEACSNLGWRVQFVSSVPQAKTAIRQGKYEALFASLGSNIRDYALSTDSSSSSSTSPRLRRRESSSSRSSSEPGDSSAGLFQYACTKAPSMFRILFSHVAVNNVDLYQDAVKQGADAVVCSYEALWQALWELLTPNHHSSTTAATTARLETESTSFSTAQAPCSSSTQYAPLEKRQQRLEQLMALAGGNPTVRSKRLLRQSELLEDKVFAIPALFTRHTNGNNTLGQYSNEHILRVVHIADTCNEHGHVDLPSGDLLLITGNICEAPPSPRPSARRRTSLQAADSTGALDQLKDFLEWLQEKVVPNFPQVVFVAGANDTLLDPLSHSHPDECIKAQELLQEFFSQNPSVAYLENNSIQYRGLTIYGSPTAFRTRTVAVEGCRGSSAFERDLDEFDKNQCGRNKGTPDDGRVDILLTHRPPSGAAGLDKFDASDYVLPVDCIYRPPTEESEEQATSDDSATSNNGPSKKKKRSLVASLLRRRSKHCPVRPHPPLLHAFGYDRHGYGLTYTADKTLLSNASQERLLRVDKYGGGTPLVVSLHLAANKSKCHICCMNDM